MQTSFHSFYNKVSAQPLDWKQVQRHFRLSEKRYPSSTQVAQYFFENFQQHTSQTFRSKWHRMDKLLLLWTAAKYAELYNKTITRLDRDDFKALADILGVPDRVLKIKWVKLSRVQLRKVPWSPQEDDKILQLMETDLASKWTNIAIVLFQEGHSPLLRTAKQIRERWVNGIDPALSRSTFTRQEDHRLIGLINSMGKRWSELGKLLNRSENKVKNRYYSLLLRQRKRARNCSNEATSSNSEVLGLLSLQPPHTLFPELGRVCGFRLLLPGEPTKPIQIN